LLIFFICFYAGQCPESFFLFSADLSCLGPSKALPSNV